MWLCFQTKSSALNPCLQLSQVTQRTRFLPCHHSAKCLGGCLHLPGWRCCSILGGSSGIWGPSRATASMLNPGWEGQLSSLFPSCECWPQPMAYPIWRGTREGVRPRARDKGRGRSGWQPRLLPQQNIRVASVCVYGMISSDEKHSEAKQTGRRWSYVFKVISS